MSKSEKGKENRVESTNNVAVIADYNTNSANYVLYDTEISSFDVCNIDFVVRCTMHQKRPGLLYIIAQIVVKYSQGITTNAMLWRWRRQNQNA